MATKPKIVIVAAANNFHFIKDLVPALSDTFDMKMLKWEHGALHFDELEAADLVWMEWADGINLPLLQGGPNFKKVILRIHRYELFSQRTLMDIANLSSAAKKRIDKLVFVSDYVRQIGIQNFPWMCESTVIPNLIDHTKFPFTARQKGYNIIMLGRMSYVKNLPLAFTMFHELLKLDSNYQLHIVGEISDPELKYYSANFIEKTGIDKNVTFYGRFDHDKLPVLMNSMHYILCTSIFESQGMGILEAMSCGLKPVVFDFPGAEKIFQKNWRFIDRSEFIFNILSPDYNPKHYHDWVRFNYSIENKIDLYKNLIWDVLEKEKQLSQTLGYMKAIRKGGH